MQLKRNKNNQRNLMNNQKKYNNNSLLKIWKIIMNSSKFKVKI